MHIQTLCVFIIAPVFRDQQSFRSIVRDYFWRSRLSINICRGKKKKENYTPTKIHGMMVNE